MKKIFFAASSDTSKFVKELDEKYKVQVSDYSTVKEDEISDFDYYVFLIVPKLDRYELIVDSVDYSNKKKDKTIFCYLQNYGTEEFIKHQIKSLDATGKMIAANGGIWCKSIEEIVSEVSK